MASSAVRERMPHKDGFMNITLFIPGLLSAEPKLLDDCCAERSALRGFLDCARSRPLTPEPDSAEAWLCAVFGLPGPQDGDYPLAALSLLMDAPEQASEGIWMRADPVYLHADPGGLLLSECTVPTLDVDALTAFAGPLRGWLEQYRMHLLTPVMERWYLRLPQMQHICTTSPLELRGRYLDAGLPRGRDQGVWHGLLNEMQMLMHKPPGGAVQWQCDPLPNSLWFWGQGRLPPVCPCPWTRVHASAVLAQGLAYHAGVPCSPLPDGLVQCQPAPEGDTLVVFMHGGMRFAAWDLAGWREWVTWLDRQWFEPLRELRNRRRLGRLAVLSGGREFRLGAPALLSFRRWR